MIRNRRKLNSLLIATLFASTLLTGCGGSSSEDATAFLDDTVNSFLGDSANVSSV